MSVYVTLPYDSAWQALDWAKKHCPSYITNIVHQNGYMTYDQSKIDYFFQDEEDALAFKLMWQNQSTSQ